MTRRLLQVIPTALFGLLMAGVAACTSGPIGPQVPAYVVFFTPFSSELDEPAKQVVADASRAATTAPARPLTVAGYADTTPVPGGSQTVSEQRVKAVVDALVASGVNRQSITRAPRGNTSGDPGIESRRVEIVFP